jgi:hypothetical protein
VPGGASMTDMERRKRIQEVLLQEMLEGEPSWFYLSFADESGFLGAGNGTL